MFYKPSIAQPGATRLLWSEILRPFNNFLIKAF